MGIMQFMQTLWMNAVHYLDKVPTMILILRLVKPVQVCVIQCKKYHAV